MLCCGCCCCPCCVQVSGELGQGLMGQNQDMSHFFAGSIAQEPRFQLVVPKSVTVEEGLCAHVPCSVSYPSYQPHFQRVFGFWFQERASLREDSPVATNDPRQLVQKATQGRFHLLGDPEKNDCSLFITDAQKNDTGVYFFRVVREPFVRYTYRGNQLSLHVIRKQ